MCLKCEQDWLLNNHISMKMRNLILIGFAVFVVDLLWRAGYSTPNLITEYSRFRHKMIGVKTFLQKDESLSNVPSNVVGEVFCERIGAHFTNGWVNVSQVGGKWVWIDDWGHPVNIVRLSKDVLKEHRYLRYSRVAGASMWSNGPNGVNELGEGDDVVLYRYPRRSERIPDDL